MKKIIEIKFNALNSTHSTIIFDTSAIDITLLKEFHIGKKNQTFDSDMNSLFVGLKEHDLSAVKSLYRFPKLNISRDKVAILADKYKLSVIRDKDKADLLVISNGFIENLCIYEYLRIIEPSTFFYYVQKGKKLYTQDMYDKLMLLKAQVNDNDTMLKIVFGTSYTYNLQKLSGYTEYQDMISNCQSSYHAILNDKSTYDYLLNNKDRLIFDSVLNSAATEDSVVLDPEMYNSIVALLSSSNAEDVNMGLTLMSNCNIEKSKGYLAVLFTFYSENMKRGTLWNTVNFKSLKVIYDTEIAVSYFRSEEVYSKLVKRLISKNVLTLELTNIVAKEMFKFIFQQTHYFNEDSVFEVSSDSIKLKSEYKVHLTNSGVIDNAAFGLNSEPLPEVADINFF